MLASDDYVPNDIRPMNLNVEVVSLNKKLTISYIHNEYDWANNSRKGIFNTISMETNTFGIPTLPVPTDQPQLLVTLLRSEIFTYRHL